ncbi:MAG: hypothetical protein IJ002_01860 [Clostridia bacterium]|nr:hypothetical protein [Clostridia bacterium]
MSAVFLKTVNMSITASWLVLAVVLLRILFKKAPKAFSCLLWALVAIRLICPFTVESALSLIPSAEPVPSEMIFVGEPIKDTYTEDVAAPAAPTVADTFEVAVTHEQTSTDSLQTFIDTAWKAWIVGIAAMLGYTLISYVSLRRKTRASIETAKGVFICDAIDTPFILGMFKPKIFLPSAMDERNTDYVVAHERAHLRRFDHLAKPFGFLLLTVYWFNPVMWAAYILFCRDIELACDERVIREMDADSKKAYSSALLACSVPRKMISACPLAFGEVGVKQRIKGVLNYKKPAFWIIVAAIVISVAVAVCFLTDPESEVGNENTLEYVFSEYESKQSNAHIVLTVPADALPSDIYSEDGHTFEKGEITVYSDDTTVIYLTNVKYANEGSDKLYFNFDCSYNLSDSGTLILPYKVDLAAYNTSFVTLLSGDLIHGGGTAEKAVTIRGYGPFEQFTFYVDTESCKSAVGEMRIHVLMNEYVYGEAVEDEETANSNTDTETTDIIGAWSAPMSVMGLDESGIPDSPTKHFIFYSDGTGVERTNVDIIPDREFIYEAENGILTITYRSDDMVQFKYSVDGDTLTLSDINDPSRTGTLTREKSDIKATQSTAGKLGMVFYDEYALPLNPKEIDRLYFEFTKEGDVSIFSGDGIQYVDDVKMNGLEGTTPEFSFRINSDAYRYAKPVIDALQTVATVSTATNSVVWNRYDRIEAANACVNVTMNGEDAAVSSVRYVDFGEYIFVAVTFGIEKQLRPGDISSFTFEIDPAAAVGSIIDVIAAETDKGYPSEFVLRVGDRLAWFEAEDIGQERSIYVSDLTGDGIDEIIVILQSNSGTGFYGEDIHIFDSITLDEYRVEKVCETVGNYVAFYDDEDNCYVKIGNTVSTVDKNVFYPDYEKKDMRARPLTDEIYSYSVSGGVLHCELKCKYTIMGTYGSIFVDYVFKDGMFVYGSSQFVE